ncbi:alkene reductase [Pseudomonas kitaguniensis]|uniref:alkene reductase n=1 Tax=Pseudomonas kitaguniensis TaxID=2607908 RepID=UPI003D0571E6
MSLFESFNLHGIELKNRIVMAPMTRARCPHNSPTDLTALYYKQRASAGLIITEGAPVSTSGRGYLFTPGIYSPQQVEGWQRVTSAVHNEGGKIFVQLWHVGRVSHSTLQEDGGSPVSSSPVRAQHTFSFAYDDQGKAGNILASSPTELTQEEIDQVVKDFVQGAINAIEAGFDGVELHGANGYLFEQFINGDLNRRTDDYGGSIENRLRFTLEVVDAVSSAIGSNRLGIRVSPFGRSSDLHGYSDEEITWLTLGLELSKRRLAYVHISNLPTLETRRQDVNFLLDFRSAYQGVLMLAGGLTGESAQRYLKAGIADLVAFGRPFIRNPDLVDRLRNQWCLMPYSKDELYGGGEGGYTDYPCYQESMAGASE